MARPDNPRALRERTIDLLWPSLRSGERAPIAICLMAWAALSALAWAIVAIVIHAL